MGTRTAAIYCRISRDKTGADLGVERQEDDGRALAKRLGWKVIKVYVGNDVSAYSGRPRPQYDALLAAMRSGLIAGVLARHPDRLHRSPRELETYIDHSETSGVATHTVQAGAWDLSTPSGRAVARTLGAWARYESEHKAQRIKAACEQRSVKRGGWHGGRRCYGWEPDGMTPREAEAAALRKAAEQIAEGLLPGVGGASQPPAENLGAVQPLPRPLVNTRHHLGPTAPKCEIEAPPANYCPYRRGNRRDPWRGCSPRK